MATRQGNELFATAVCPWKDDARAAVTLTLDGAYQGTFQRAMGLFSRYEVPATWFVVTGSVGASLEGRPVVSWKELEEASQRGMEIASHTVTHPDLALAWSWLFHRYVRRRVKKAYKLVIPGGLRRAAFLFSILRHLSRGVPREQILEEAQKSKRAIERVTGAPVVSFAYPGGRYDPATMEKLKAGGYLSARSVDPGCNLPDSVNLYALRSQVWDIRVRPAKANQWVDDALEKGGWLIETYHVISESGTTGYYWDTSVSDFDRHLSYLRSRGPWVDTQQRIAKYLLERMSMRFAPQAIAGSELHLHLETPLDPDLFDQPLTLKTRVPHDWIKVAVEQDGRCWAVESQEQENGRVVVYDVLPRNGRVTLTPLGH